MTQTPQKVSQPFTKTFGDVLLYFWKTPKSIVCPHFWELKWAFGCPSECAYCYLQGTGWGDKHPRYRALDFVLTKIDQSFKVPLKDLPKNKPIIASSGELADSLMNPTMMEKIADKYEEQDRHKLLLLSKVSNVGWLVAKNRRQTIVSFSLNPKSVARKWEKKTATPAKRINAAKSVFEAGYETRLRIDPMIPVDGWTVKYKELIDDIFKNLEPERITFGTLRGLWKTIHYSKDDSWVKYLSDDKTGWGKKIDNDLRRSMYTTVVNHLKDEYNYTKIALCKETENMWREIGLDPGTYVSPLHDNWKKCQCNCVW